MATKILTVRIPDKNEFGTPIGAVRDDFYHSNTRSGVSVAGWKQKIKEKRDASSPYYADFVDVLESTPIDCVNIFGNQGLPWRLERQYKGYLSYGGHLLGPHLGSVSTSQDNAAIAKVYERIREERSAMNGLLALAEIRQTVALLSNPARLGAKLVTNYLSELKSTRSLVRRQVKPRRSDTARSLVNRRLNATKDRMSGSWLALQFGILPTISDAQDILQEVANSSVNALTARPGRISARSEEVVISEPNYAGILGYPLGYGLRLDLNTSLITKCSVQYKVGLNNAAQGPWNQVNSMSDRLGFTVENFVPTIYEMIPWSFLVDYFSNLGDIVSAFTTSTSNVFYVTKTTRQETTSVLTERLWFVEPSPSYGSEMTYSLNGNSAGKRVSRHRTITRTVLGSIPIPSLELSVPPLLKKDDSANKQWFNMGALLAQARDFKF